MELRVRRRQSLLLYFERTAIAPLVALATLASGLACSAETKAQMHVTRARPTPETLLRGATFVVRVKIASSEPVRWNGEDSPSCGFRHSAEVVETLKGNLEGDAGFLWDELLTTGDSYLVALRDFTGEVPEEIDDPLLPESVAENLQCRIRIPVHAVGAVRVTETDGRLWAAEVGTRIIPRTASRYVVDDRISWESLQTEILKTLRANTH